MSDTGYPPFSGDDPVCPKCLKVGAITEYMRYGECTHGRLNEVIGFDTNERLHRECSRCGYPWDEHLAVPVTVVDVDKIKDVGR